MLCWSDSSCVVVTALHASDHQQMAATAELRAALEGFEREADDGSTITLHQFELASLANLMQVRSPTLLHSTVQCRVHNCSILFSTIQQSDIGQGLCCHKPQQLPNATCDLL
jgi:hypothetical protein